jgi:sugar lactone lactonase YvrE
MLANDLSRRIGLKTSRYEIEVVREERNLVGESPLWHPEEKALYWIDTRRPSIQRLTSTGEYKKWMMPNKLGSIALRQKGGFVAGTQRGFCEFDPVTGAVTTIVDPEACTPDNRLNDGKIDRRGRYWCVSRDASDDHAGGSLFRLDPDHSCHKVDTGFIVGNGLAISPDDKMMVVADTYSEVVYAYDFDLDAGRIGNKRVFFSTRDMPWYTDGGTFDSEGYYWCALVFDWSIGRFDPTGRLDRIIRLPVNAPTMCSFGGEGLDVLFVTTASLFLSESEKPQQPLAGALFAIRNLGAKGVPEPRFAG